MKTPKAPSPTETAQAQAGYNRDTALTEQMINMTGQTGPWGSISYDQTGNSSFVGADGKVVNVPRYTQTTTLTPEQQAIFDATQGAETNLANLAKEQSAKLQGYLSEPFEFNNRDAETWAYDLASPRLLEQQQQRQNQVRTQLINSGLRPGSEAYDREMQRLAYADNDQLNQLALQGRGQAFAEAQQLRSQPINEITALMSGSQIDNPNAMYGGTPQVGVGGVDYAGMVQQNYQNRLNASSAGLGGLFGLAGSLGGGLLSGNLLGGKK